jgi:hypothetical protein
MKTEQIMLNIFGGIAAAAIFLLIQLIIKKITFLVRYYKLTSKDYIWYFKNDANQTPKYNILFSLPFSLNRINFTGVTVEKNIKLHGYINMDEKLPYYGKGYYKNDDNISFGFLEVQLNPKSEELFIHIHFVTTGLTDESRKITHIGYIAKPIKKQSNSARSFPNA